MSAATPAERQQAGEAARRRVPHEAHAEVALHTDRDPVAVIAAQGLSRVPSLLPVRHARMAVSPFTFYRGAAAVMAGDLADSPVSGLEAQLCGDAHLSNFGMFASAERNLLFDLNDFDETHPGPWEWDLKRLAASLVAAGRENGFTARQTRKVVRATVLRYRDAMEHFAAVGNLAVWYSRVDTEEALRLLGPELDPQLRTRLDRSVSKARSRDHIRSLTKLTEVVDGRRRIIPDPPLVVPLSDMAGDLSADEAQAMVEHLLMGYSSSMDHAARLLVRSYSFVDMARKVVGVGSVGTRCWVVLMRGRDDDDPLFLQVKEAQASVLAAHLDSPGFDHEGERVVRGQRIMQASGDAFLGWQRAIGLDGMSRDFYVRQLQDWKGSAKTETMTPRGLRLYGGLCAWTLARAHARSGDRIAIAAYLGTGDAFAEALADFAEGYADVNERDHAAFSAAIAAGEVAAAEVGAR